MPKVTKSAAARKKAAENEVSAKEAAEQAALKEAARPARERLDEYVSERGGHTLFSTPEEGVLQGEARIGTMNLVATGVGMADVSEKLLTMLED